MRRCAASTDLLQKEMTRTVSLKDEGNNDLAIVDCPEGNDDPAQPAGNDDQCAHESQDQQNPEDILLAQQNDECKEKINRHLASTTFWLMYSIRRRAVTLGSC